MSSGAQVASPMTPDYKPQGRGPICFCSLELNVLPPGLSLAPGPQGMAQVCTPALPGQVKVVTVSGLCISEQEGAIRPRSWKKKETLSSANKSRWEQQQEFIQADPPPVSSTSSPRGRQVSPPRKLFRNSPLRDPRGQPYTHSQQLTPPARSQCARHILNTNYLFYY